MTFFGPDIRNGLPIGLGSMAGFGRRAFTPSVLFAAGEQGFWYDPSDLSSMYQDSAGTTPVTAVEQAVGLILDKSKGLVLGGSLISGGAIGVGGVATAATYNTGTGAGTATRVDVGNQSFVEWSGLTPAGSLYEVTIQNTGATILVVRHGFAGAIQLTVSAGATVTARLLSSSLSTLTIAAANNGTSVAFTVQSFRALAGNHAIQPGATNRPILRSRYNLLTYSEQFDAADWIKGNNGVGLAPVVTANAGTAPNGTATADRIQFDCGDTSSITNRSRIQQPITVISGQGMTGALWVKAFDAGNVGKTLRIIVEQTATQVIHTLTADWALVTMPGTTASTSINFLFETRGTFTTQTADVLVWGADLRRSSDTYLPYQRIGAATDYDVVGFPVYLAFDGSDDSLYTGGNVDFSATDKMTVWAGVTKLSDGAETMLAELSANAATNAGAFNIFAPGGLVVARDNAYVVVCGGTTRNAFGVAAANYPAPITNVLTMQDLIPDDTASLRVDGVVAASSALDQGTGNYGNYPLYIGRRNNATLPFNGRVYALLGRGAATSAALLSQAERWVAGKQGRAL